MLASSSISCCCWAKLWAVRRTETEDGMILGLACFSESEGDSRAPADELAHPLVEDLLAVSIEDLARPMSSVCRGYSFLSST